MKTWDGLPVSQDRPFGATILVYRRVQDQVEFLLLHRSFYGSDYAGEWAWTPPSGARLPGETIYECAWRELNEEIGLNPILQPSEFGNEDWTVYTALIPTGNEIGLSAEHDRFDWVSYEEACLRCQPEVVCEPFRKFVLHLEVDHGTEK